MKKFALSTITAAMLASPAASSFADAYIGSQMADTLQSLSPAESVMAVVTYDQMDPLASAQISKLMGLGITEGVQFKNLPIIGVVANKVQIEAIAEMDGVLSIYANREMTYYNADARQITGVADLQGEEAIQNDMEYTGKGSTVLVIDSGIDATHADLPFGDKVVDNVQAITNPSLLSIVGVTGPKFARQPNTDLNSGHGTHCAGTIAGLGTRSGGKHVGAAPGADLIGYGSGAVVLLLDTIGGFDYALSNQYSFDNPIKVISNSWGSSGKYDHRSPVSMATYAAHRAGMISVFAAGNSGPGEDSHNPHAQIPWGISVGAGTKSGTLAGFSSRGLKGESGTFTMPDGEEWTYNNEVSIVAPGVDIISPRAVLNLGANGLPDDFTAMPPEEVPFYTQISGTSMATPHVAGIIALMLEANPNLSNLDIKRILQESATNIPGFERWEVGAGYVNARSAVAGALLSDVEHKVTVNNLPEKKFNSNAVSVPSERVETMSVFYSPLGAPEVVTFEVGENESFVKASASTLANLTKLVLVDPEGKEYRGNLTTPVLGTAMRVAAPGMPGTWSLYVYGLTSLSGIEADPLGLTNGPGLPEFFDVTVTFEESGGFEGLKGVDGHEHENAIKKAVSERLMDGMRKGFGPNVRLTRGAFAQYAMMGGAVRQYRDLGTGEQPNFAGIPPKQKPYLQSVMVGGGALKDITRVQGPILLDKDGSADLNGSMKNVDMAYALVQMLGLESVANNFNPEEDRIMVEVDGTMVELSDQDSIPAELRGHVQAALTFSLMNASFDLETVPMQEPVVTANFNPNKVVRRGEYAVLAVRLFEQYYQ